MTSWAKRSSLFILAAGLSTALLACSSARDNASTEIVSASAIVASGASDADKAEQLAESAEKLLTAEGVVQAVQLADKALELDRGNLRAAFIRVMTGPIMIQKGFFARVKGLAAKHPTFQSRYDFELRQMRAYNPPALQHFFLDGEPDINTEDDVQAYVDALADSLVAIREFMLKNRDAELTIRPTSALIPNLIERYARACDIVTTANLEFELKCPAPETKTRVTLNRADFEAFRQLIAFYLVSLYSGNAFTLSGAIDVIKARNDGTQLEPQKMADQLMGSPLFGRLRAKQGLTAVKGLNLDLVAGLRWILARQGELCPAGGYEGNPRNRPGMFFNTGLCMGAAFNPYINLLESISRGDGQTSSSEKKGKNYTTTMFPVKFFNRPPPDLHALGPLKVDRCGGLDGVGDPTLWGVFPAGDANQVLPLASESCELE